MVTANRTITHVTSGGGVTLCWPIPLTHDESVVGYLSADTLPLIEAAASAHAIALYIDDHIQTDQRFSIVKLCPAVAALVAAAFQEAHPRG